MNRIWRADPRRIRHLRRWNDEAVLFCPETWQTQLLSPAASEILCRLEAAPRTLDQLASELSGEDDGEAVKADLSNVLASLESLGLVCRSESALP